MTGAKALTEDKETLQNGHNLKIDISPAMKEAEKEHTRDSWNHKLDFVLSLIGFTVGLGNIWRFPYLCMRNGGGAFLVPYFLFLFLCGMPMFFLEVAMGQFSSRSAMHVWECVPLFRGLGWGAILASAICSLYYNVIITWILYYLVKSFTGKLPWTTCDNWWNTPHCKEGIWINEINNTLSNYTAYSMTPAPYEQTIINTTGSSNISISRSPADEFWQFEVLQRSSGIHELGGIRWQLLLCLIGGWFLVFLGLFKGVHSLGKVVYVTATLPYVLLMILLVRGMTLEGSLDGIYYYIVPDWNRLAEFQVWGDGCTQIFYTLGPAWGTIITMASYNKFDNNCLRDSVMTCLICCGSSFFAGFVVFSILGFMAHEQGVTVQEISDSGPGLIFVAYPEAISKLPISPLWAILFFFMLLILGLDSQFGMVETVSSAFVDQFPRFFSGSRKVHLVASICFVQVVLGIPLICKGGIYVFQIIDWYVAIFAIWVIALLELLAWCYLYGVNRIYDDIELMTGSRPSLWWKICWCGITPIMLLSILVISCLEMNPPTHGEYVYPWWANAIGWCIASISIVPIPFVAAFEIHRTKGTFTERIRTLIKPNNLWGPALDCNRINTRYERKAVETPLLDLGHLRLSLDHTERVYLDEHGNLRMKEPEKDENVIVGVEEEGTDSERDDHGGDKQNISQDEKDETCGETEISKDENHGSGNYNLDMIEKGDPPPDDVYLDKKETDRTEPVES